MNNSNSPSNTKSSRVTLKLPAGPRKSPRESKTPPIARPPGSQQTSSQQPGSQQPLSQQKRADKQKPGAHWSDEYKERMQAEMDALISR
jgi:hypothetical protein